MDTVVGGSASKSPALGFLVVDLLANLTVSQLGAMLDHQATC